MRVRVLRVWAEKGSPFCASIEKAFQSATARVGGMFAVVGQLNVDDTAAAALALRAHHIA